MNHILCKLLLCFLGFLLLISKFNRLRDATLEVYNFIIDEVLVDFHFLFKVAHFSLINELQDSGTSILNGVYTFLLQVEDLLSDLCLEVSVTFIIYFLALSMQ